MPHPIVKWSVSAIPLIAAVLLQTVAPAVWAQPASGPVRAIPVAQGLENPWAVAFLPEGRFLVTERPGRLRVVEADGRLNPPVAGLPWVAAGGQGGLLDVVLDRGFASNRTLYFCFSEPAPAGAAGNSTALARARLSEDRTRLDDLRVVFSQRPKVASSLHFGCRIVEGMKDGRPDGTLFLTLGERFQRMQDAQTLDNHHGKVVRVGKDGSVPKDNPFVGRAGALPSLPIRTILPWWLSSVCASSRREKRSPNVRNSVPSGRSTMRQPKCAVLLNLGCWLKMTFTSSSRFAS